MVLSISPFILINLMKGRTGQNLIDSSGRVANYIRSWKLFCAKPIFGYGLGLNNLYLKTKLSVPHNFFIQYLVQLGLIDTMCLCYCFIVFIKESFREKSLGKWMFWMTAIGAMAIPDIVSSRFLFCIIVLCMASPNNEKIGEYYEKES